jgi:F0F1-type ATP synthase alpha subunit
LDKLTVAQIPEFERRLIEHITLKYPELPEEIQKTGKLEKETEDRLRSALNALLADYEIAV